MNEEKVRELKFLLKTYDALNRAIVSTKNRLTSMNPDAKHEHDWLLNGWKTGKTKYHGLENIKGRVSRQIEKCLQYWDIWNAWLKDVPGCGPHCAGNLIVLYYYRFVPICKKCGADLVEFECPEHGKAKGDGVLNFRIEEREHQNVGKWWAHLGLHNDEEGKKPKRQAGKKSNWSNIGRQISWALGEGFIKSKNEYYKHYLEKKAEYERTRPDWTKAHRSNAAANVAVKLFQSHFWHVARTIEGKPTINPYVQDILGHSNIVPPYYWDNNQKNVEIQLPDVSHYCSEIQKPGVNHCRCEIQ